MWCRPEYRHNSPGFNAVGEFFRHFKGQIVEGESIIDFGCGTGMASSAFFFEGLSVRMVDIAANCLDEKVVHLLTLCPEKIAFIEACLWKLPKFLDQADWIYCCDVLEHLPTKYIDIALFQMASRTKKGGFLQIFLKEEPYGDLIEKKLHLTVQSKEWWLDKIKKYWKIDAFGPEIEGYRFSVYIRCLA